MITEILILAFAGLLKAVKDRIDNPYTKSIFSKGGAFWNKGTGKQILGFYFDAWHIADWLYISCFCVLLALHYSLLEIGMWNALLYFSITQVTFNIFYFIFKKR
jgi:hypothetical protein